MNKKIDSQALIELWNKGMTVAEIADRLCVKVDAVYKHARSLGLPLHKSSRDTILSDPEKKKWFVRNYPELGNGIIAVYLGISESWVGNLARQLGLEKSEAYKEGMREFRKNQIRKNNQSK